jgi:alpha-tubulin suppressor-like RCC1 family protein
MPLNLEKWLLTVQQSPVSAVTGTIHTNVSFPSIVNVNSSPYTQISTGMLDDNTRVMIDGTGTLAVTSINQYGQLGNNLFNPFNLTTSTTIQSGSWLQATTDGYSVLAIKKDGTLWAWGLNDNGQIGATQDNPTFSKISNNQFHTLAITTQGSLLAWGDNTNGRLGIGSNSASIISYPVAIDSQNSWKAVSAGLNNSAAIRNDNTLWTWGQNAQGQLGTGNLISRSSPVQVAGSWTAVSAGSSHMMALDTNGAVYAWGDNTYGQVGNVTKSWTQVACSSNHTLAVASDGTMWGWGLYVSGQLGSYYPFSRSAPMQITATGSWNLVAAGSLHSLAIDQSGALYAWGLNSSGQLGDSTTISKSSPVNIGTSLWTAISAGSFYSLAIRIDGALYAWGDNTYGQIGNNATINRNSPVLVSGGGSWTAVSAGSSHALGIKTDGSLWTWGYNNNGQLGDQISTVNSWAQISIGTSHTLALRSDGALFTWGGNTSGQLGNSTVVSTSSPGQIGTGTWIAVAAGGLHSAAIRNDGALFTWGSNTNGRLGDFTVIARSSPVQVSGGGSWAAVACGLSSTSGIKSFSLFSWGANVSGVLGIGAAANTTTSSRSSPSQVGTSSWTFVSLVSLNVLAITTTGLLWSWGDGASGKIGDGFAVNRSAPVQVGTGFSWKSASPGQNHSSAIRNDNTLWLWGLGTTGQLGDNTRVTKSSPVQVAGTGTWAATASGDSYTVAIKLDGSLYSWGATTNNLGDGGANRSSPVQIASSIGTWTSVTANFSSAIAIGVGRSLWAWGNNLSGQLGLNDTTSRASPVQVIFSFLPRSQPFQIGTNSWKAVAAGTEFSLALRNDDTLWVWGRNDNYQLGQGNLAYKASPVQIAGTWTNIAAGNTFGIGKRSDLQIYSWGLRNGSTSTAPSTTAASTDSNLIAAGGSTIAYTTAGGRLFLQGPNTGGQLGDGTVNLSASWVIPIRPPVFLSPLVITTLTNASITSAFPSSFTQISAGSLQSIALGADTIAWAWGYGNAGALGTGSFADTTNPSSMKTPDAVIVSNVTQISAGGNHSLVYQSTTNRILATGNNFYGQLGTSSATVSYLTTVTTTLSPAIISAGNFHSTVLTTNGLLWAWGYNGFSQLGDGTILNRSSPVQISALSGSFVFIDAGVQSTFAVQTATNFLYSAGENVNGILGRAGTSPFALVTSGPYVVSPVQIGTSSWSSVDSGNRFNLAVRSDRTLWAWGLNSSGQLGLGDVISRSTPTQIAGLWKSASGGGTHALAIDSNNALYAWGTNDLGQLGLSDLVSRSSPVLVNSGEWLSASAGLGQSLAINGQGNLFGWGDYTAAGIVQNYSWTSVSVSYGAPIFYAGIRSDGGLWTWGDNNNGQLGHGDRTYRPNPTLLGYSWSQVSCGNRRMAAIKSDGTLWTWGYNNSGQIGDGTTVERSSPVQVTGGGSWTSVVQGFLHVLGIKTDGTLWTWGYNNSGQLGDGTRISRSTPVQIGSASWSSISAGNDHSGGLQGFSLYMWGYNAAGQLGDGTNLPRSSPVLIAAGYNSGTKKISLRRENSTAIIYPNIYNTATTVLRTWGVNGNGQLGRGSFDNSNVPVTIGYGWTDVTAIGYSMVGFKTDGLMYGWGERLWGNIGGYAAITSPQINGLSSFNWKMMSGYSGYTYSYGNSGQVMALTDGGQLWTWGNQISPGGVARPYDNPNNLYTLTYRSSPTQIGSSNQWTKIFAGNQISLAINQNKVYGWGLNNTVTSPTQNFNNRAGFPDNYTAGPTLIGNSANSASAANWVTILKR